MFNDMQLCVWVFSPSAGEGTANAVNWAELSGYSNTTLSPAETTNLVIFGAATHQSMSEQVFMSALG